LQVVKKELLVTSLQEFELAYSQWVTAYGDKHLQVLLLCEALSY
jgi:hypothetical protein